MDVSGDMEVSFSPCNIEPRLFWFHMLPAISTVVSRPMIRTCSISIKEASIIAVSALDDLVNDLVKASSLNMSPAFLDWVADEATSLVECMSRIFSTAHGLPTAFAWVPQGLPWRAGCATGCATACAPGQWSTSTNWPGTCRSLHRAGLRAWRQGQGHPCMNGHVAAPRQRVIRGASRLAQA